MRFTVSTPFSYYLVLILALNVVLAEYSAESDGHHEGKGPSEIQHTLMPPFLHSEYDNEYWDFGGNTVVRVYDYIRLTSAQPNQNGWVWSKHTLDAAAWSIEIEFKIHGEHANFFGDGFALWFTEDRYESGPVFGAKDQFKGLGLFFDTFPNGKHEHSFPYISAMVGDGHMSYDHGNDNKGSIAGYGCEANIRGTKQNVLAHLTYYKNDILKLELSETGSDRWQTCFVLSDVKLPDKGHIGMSARTGELYDNHDIMKLETFIHLLHEEYNEHDAKSSKHEEPTKRDSSSSYSSETKTTSRDGGFLSTLVRLIGFGALLVIAAMAYRTYSSTSSAKKF